MNRIFALHRHLCSSKNARADEPPRPIAINAMDVKGRTSTVYPAPFAAMIEGREKRALGDVFGLTNFGVNLTRIPPRSRSALRHAHSKQDELIYILQGHPTLKTDEGNTQLAPGMCAGFKSGTGNAHHLVNESDDETVVYLEIGDRSAGDQVTYPDDDLKADFVDGKWKISHKDGTPY
eukprot:TRINITY_DN3937_c0_g1_i1.p1 TRINITY_DN3937_c0_g1~~TRINITY_DN3937_c0_g1_i1.p1  ORF type:complete len:178 (-),score=42.02 TRINITY_DN3937_c0_g1_i1:126-659(-)